MEQSLYEKLGGSYTKVGNNLLPDLTIPKTIPIGKYGRMRKRRVTL